MTSTSYLILAYAIAIVFLWGYAGVTWWRWRRLQREDRAGAKQR